MKIYTKIILSLETSEVLHEESHDYNGDISLCKGGGNVYAPPAPPKTAVEQETEALYLQTLKDMNAKTGAYAPTELDKLTEQYGTLVMKDYIENMPEEKAFREKSLQLLTQNLEFQAKQLQNLSDMQQLGEITGDLTQTEKDMFQTMADQAKQKIADSVNREQSDVMEEAIASLVDRGVLQGGVGVQILGKIGERAQELIAQGASDVETQKLSNMLNTIESNKNRAIQWANVGLGQQQIISGIANSSMQAASQQLINTTGTQQYAAGLKESYTKDALAGYSSYLGNVSAERTSQANNALQAAIASSQKKVAMETAKASAWGSALGFGGQAVASYYGGGGSK